MTCDLIRVYIYKNTNTGHVVIERGQNHAATVQLRPRIHDQPVMVCQNIRLVLTTYNVKVKQRKKLIVGEKAKLIKPMIVYGTISFRNIIRC